MRVRYRLLLAMGFTLLVTGLGVYTVSSRSMIEGFVALEDDRAREDVSRVDQALKNMIDDLHTKSVDWSNWDDTYAFMKDHNRNYLKSNMVSQSFIDLKVDMVLLLDTSKKKLFSLSVRRSDHSALMDADQVRAELMRNGFLDEVEPRGPGKSGIVLCKGVPAAITVRPIQDTKGGGERRGWFIFARYLDAETEDDLRRITRHDVSLHAASDAKSGRAIANLSGQASLVRPVNDETLVGISLVRDIHGEPALVLKTKLQRKVFLHGKQVVDLMSWQLLAIGGGFGLVVLWIIEKVALSRLNRLSKQVETITASVGAGRVDLPGGDELSFLATRINDMLESVEAAASLRDSEQRLRTQKSDLEILVQERTQELQYLAFHDKLTGLPNRALFLDRVDLALGQAQTRGSGTAALFIDLDNFKLVNDSLGHDVGDELLVAVSRRLVAAVRPGDTVSRLGGDEFMILLEGLASVDEAADIAERVLGNLREPIKLGNREMFVSCSVGIAFCQGATLTSDFLLKNADTAMYRTKLAGKSNYVIFDESMHDETIDRLELETSLRRALECNEIFIAYQPLIDLDTHSMVGAEALARWNHPGRGLVAPEQFIPIAEETGLVVPIGYWILEESCRLAKQWSDEFNLPDLTISVNLSAKQMQREDVVDRVCEVLERTGLRPSCLKLEITESVLVKDRDDVVAKMRRLKEVGVMLALDDFGTGYSSLSTLQAFPIDTLKIDRSFIGRLEEEESAMAIVEAILALAHTMNIDVTGEGVETPYQEQVIHSLGCRTGQGYLYDRPMSADEFRLNLRSRLDRSAANKTTRLSKSKAA